MEGHGLGRSRALGDSRSAGTRFFLASWARLSLTFLLFFFLPTGSLAASHRTSASTAFSCRTPAFSSPSRSLVRSMALFLSQSSCLSRIRKPNKTIYLKAAPVPVETRKIYPRKSNTIHCFHRPSSHPRHPAPPPPDLDPHLPLALPSALGPLPLFLALPPLLRLRRSG